MSWSDLEAAEPDFAAGVRARLDAHVDYIPPPTPNTIATLRRDGSPRISGIETFWAEGDAGDRLIVQSWRAGVAGVRRLARE